MAAASDHPRTPVTTRRRSPEKPKVSERPVLPGNPSREQITTHINALGAWLAEIKALTRAEAIDVWQRAGGCGGGRQYIEQLMTRFSIPFPGHREPLEWSVLKKQPVDPPPAITESHYTDEGLAHLLQTRTTEVDAWLAGVREHLLREMRGGSFGSSITKSRIQSWLSRTRQPKLATTHEVSVYFGQGHWTQDEAPDTDAIAASADTALRAWVQAQGASAGAVDLKIQVTTTSGLK